MAQEKTSTDERESEREYQDSHGFVPFRVYNDTDPDYPEEGGYIYVTPTNMDCPLAFFDRENDARIYAALLNIAAAKMQKALDLGGVAKWAIEQEAKGKL